jgi:hypothetical protein
MDYVTRQFINLAKKLRSDLRQTLKKHTDAINQSTKAARENKQAQLPIPLPVIAELQLPEADKTERRSQHKENRTLQIWLIVGTWLAFLAASIYAGIAAAQLRQMRNANRPWIGMSDRLAIKSSPSLSFTDMSTLFGKQGEQVREISIKFLVSGTIKNFGSSPARREYSTFEAISLGDILAQFRDEDCARSEDISRGKYRIRNTISNPADNISIDPPARAIFPSVELPVEESIDLLVDLNPNPYSISPFPLSEVANPPPKWTDRIPHHLWIVGCIAYQDTANQMHHTKVFYQSSLIGEMPKIAEDANPSDIRLTFGDFVMEDSESD